MIRLKCILLAVELLYLSSAAFAQDGGDNRPSQPSTVSRPKSIMTPSPSRPPVRPPKPKLLPIPVASLTIKSNPPNCLIMIGGEDYGRTNANGVLPLKRLKPGKYTILAAKPDYRSAIYTVELIRDSDNTLEVGLSPEDGTVNITPNVSGTEIVFSNGGNFIGQVNDLKLAPGRYRVDITRPGYRIFSQLVEVKAARTSDLNPKLEPLPIAEAYAAARNAFDRKDFPTAAAISESILAQNPDDLSVNLLLGYTHYRSGQFETSIPYLTKAVAGGETAMFAVQYYWKANGTKPDIGKLIFKRGAFTLQSSSNSAHNFQVSTTKLYNLRADLVRTGRITLKVGISKGKREERRDFAFQLLNDPTNTLYSRNDGTCANCTETVRVADALMRAIKN